MANANGSSDLIDDEGSSHITISRERQLVALEATWETEKLCQVLREAVQTNADSGEHFVVRALSARIQELACVIMSALGDEMAPTEGLRYRLTLERDGNT